MRDSDGRSPDNAKGKFKVGYKRPPAHTRWKEGQSGNPAGRPKGSRNFATEIQRELRAKVTVTENGRKRRIQKRTAVAKQLVNKAASGDLKAADKVIAEDRLYNSARNDGGENPPNVLNEAETLTLQHLIARIRASQPIPGSITDLANPTDFPIASESARAAHEDGKDRT